MGQENERVQEWLDTATRGIRFEPDRKAVAVELAGHLEDKAADLQRIFPDMPPEETQVKAVEQMGDAAELGRQLAKIHKPWLGYLWRASKWAAMLLTTLFVVVSVVANDHYQSAGHPLWGAFSTRYGSIQGQQAQLGGYSFCITGAAFLDYPENRPQRDQIQLTLRVSSPRFWERIDQWAVQRGLTVVTGDGTRWFMLGQTVSMEQGDYYQVVNGLQLIRWGPFFQEFAIYFEEDDWQCGDRATLDFKFEQGSFALTADVTQRVVME